MTTVRVNASGAYDVVIGKGLIGKAGEYIHSLRPGGAKTAIISDDKVFSLYGDLLISSLEKSGFSPVTFIFKNGEASKNLQTFGEALNFLAEKRITRTDLVIALGGGVVGDLAGFVSAAYLRGMDFVQIPTTILAAVDSSVGGKTAVDLPAGKNLAGAFHQPSLVLCDTDAFLTLDERQRACGYSEIIKYGVMCDKELFDALCDGGLSEEEIITRCVEIKRDVVEKDEFDRGDRKKLNLGHTAGHAVEALSNFSMTHGDAVAIGMVIISKISERRGYAKEKMTGRLKDILKKYGLPTECNNTANEVFSVATADKKTEGTSITLVIPTKIGECILEKLPLQKFSEMLEEVL